MTLLISSRSGSEKLPAKNIGFGSNYRQLKSMFKAMTYGTIFFLSLHKYMLGYEGLQFHLHFVML